MRPMHTYRFDPLDRWLASVKMKTAPDLFLGSPLPDGDAIWLIASQGLTGRHYNLSLAVYHPRLADRATPDIELARFVGHADDPGARFGPSTCSAGLEGTTDIPIGPVLQIGSDEKHLVRLRLYNLWLCDALAYHSEVGTRKEFERQQVGPGKELESSVDAYVWRFGFRDRVGVYTATAVQTVEVPVDVQTNASHYEHTAKENERHRKSDGQDEDDQINAAHAAISGVDSTGDNGDGDAGSTTV
ncbi:hypothetical protein B0H14DRAFT_2641157 [Mycena olivaceomarginata]|nr:hypothetical protein B0H14DRAFT_2641157 [Mycena olivaceomarginata]